MPDSAPVDSTQPARPWPTLAGVALLALANAGLVVGGALWAAGKVPAQPADPGWVGRATQAAEGRAASVARSVFAAGTEAAAIAATGHLAAQGVAFELVGLVDGRPRVIAASDVTRVGQAPDGPLTEVLRGKAPEREVALPPAGARADYTATFAQPLRPPAPAAAPVPAATARPAGPKPEAKAVARTYVVRPGDTLYKISRDQYGDASMFYAIWEANRARIPDRSNLVSGLRLTLPPAPGASAEAPAAAPAAEAPAAASAPAAAPAPRRYALRLGVPLEGRPALFSGDRALLTGAAGFGAVGVLGAWWLAWALLDRRRRRELSAQRRALLGEAAHRFRPKPRPFDRAAVRSPWQVEHATAQLPGDVPGGAFTDFRLHSESKLGLVIGDATGWNVPALGARGAAGLLWRAIAAEHDGPDRTLVALNRELTDTLAPGEHVTAFCAQIDTLSGSVAYASAGHAGAYVLGRRGGLTMLNGRGVPLGVEQALFAERLELGHVRLAEGESLLLFTDGLLKAENPDGEPFGLERLEKCLRERPGCNADEIVATVRAAVEGFTGRAAVDDEAAILCLRLVSPLVLYPKLVAEPISGSSKIHIEEM